MNWIPNSKRKRRVRWNPIPRKRKFLKPFGDFDGDKVWNAFDCKPFDYKKQGKIHEVSKELREEREKELKEMKGEKWHKNKLRKAAADADRFVEELKEQEYKADKDRFLGVARKAGLKAK